MFGEDEETSDVPRLILKAMSENIEAIKLGSARAGDGGGVKKTVVEKHLDSTCSVFDGLTVEAETSERTVTVSKGHRMADNSFEVGGKDAGDGKKTVMDKEIDFLGDEERVAEKEVVVAKGGAFHGAFDGEDGVVGEVEGEGGDGVGEGTAGECGARRDGGFSGEFGVSAGRALEGNTDGVDGGGDGIRGGFV